MWVHQATRLRRHHSDVEDECHSGVPHVKGKLGTGTPENSVLL